MEWNYIDRNGVTSTNGVTSATKIVLKHTVGMSLPWNQYMVCQAIKAVRQQHVRADDEDEAESDESEE
jgi:hypothetical protein